MPEILLIAFIIFTAISSLIIRSNQKRPIVLPIVGITNILYLFLYILNSNSHLPYFVSYDSLGKLIYLSYSILFLMIAFYCVDYLKMRKERDNRFFVSFMIINLAAGYITCFANNLGTLWFAMEATTLTMSPLIYFNKTKKSIEATWKFIMITSIGIAIALLGIYMMGYTAMQVNKTGTLNISELVQLAPLMNQKWLLFASIFILLGFATKIGLAPFHWWKPDVYGEAPGVVGAMLSGGLVSLSGLAILRIYYIVYNSAIMTQFQHVLILLGILSLFFAAVFISGQSDLKRLLAYSSVEHVGIFAFGLGIGKIGIFGSILHIFFNTYAKGALFLSAGDAQRIFSTKNLSDMKGVIGINALLGIIFLSAIIAAAGSPPFSLFVSEFYIVTAAIKNGYIVSSVVFIFLLFFIFMGIMKNVIELIYGKSLKDNCCDELAPTLKMQLTELILLVFLLIFTFYLPSTVSSLLKDILFTYGVTL